MIYDVPDATFCELMVFLNKVIKFREDKTLYNVDFSFGAEKCFMLIYGKCIVLYNTYMYINIIPVLVIHVISANTANAHGLLLVKHPVYTTGDLCIMDLWDPFD